MSLYVHYMRIGNRYPRIKDMCVKRQNTKPSNHHHSTPLNHRTALDTNISAIVVMGQPQFYSHK
jgi:hypothetical protein